MNTHTHLVRVFLLAAALLAFTATGAIAQPPTGPDDVVNPGRDVLEFEQVDNLGPYGETTQDQRIYVDMGINSRGDWIVESSLLELENQATAKWNATVSCPQRLLELRAVHPDGWAGSTVKNQSLGPLQSNVVGSAWLQSVRAKTLADECVARVSSGALDPYDLSMAHFTLVGVGDDRLYVERVCSAWDGSGFWLDTAHYQPKFEVFCVESVPGP